MMLDNTIEIPYIQGKLTENLLIQTKMLQSGMQVPKCIHDRQNSLEEELENLKKANSTEAA